MMAGKPVKECGAKRYVRYPLLDKKVIGRHFKYKVEPLRLAAVETAVVRVL